MFDIIGRRFWFFLISGIAVLVSIVSLATLGLKPGIDFSSGSVLTASFEQKVTQDELKQELTNLGLGNAIVQSTGVGDFLIRSVELTTVEKTKLKENLTAKFGPLEEKGFENVDPIIARQTSRTAGIAIAVSAVSILLYITWAFRRMPRPFHYGVCAIIALLHDVLIVLGVFAILGSILNWEINLMFITGILAVIGYSINNTVVVFDRIRENLTKGISPDFEVVVNNGVVETISRCLNTSLTTLVVILALILFVGASIQNFAVVFLIGLVIGTFDSICIAPSLLVVWEKKEWGRFFKRPRTYTANVK
ncbi:MAG: protein translocase subunit SecF [Chloroflexi bacterium]|nr:protein translocase subunit SecF [Chloroflexota bacterium]